MFSSHEIDYSCLSESKPYRYFSCARSHTVSLRVSSVTESKDPTWQKHGSATQITALICSRDKKKKKSNTRNSTCSNKTCRTKKKQNILPAAHNVSRESRQQADSTADFILAARGLPLVHPGLIYVPSAAEGQRSRRWLGGRDAWQLHPHQPSACRSSCPSGSGKRKAGRQAFREGKMADGAPGLGCVEWMGNFLILI